MSLALSSDHVYSVGSRCPFDRLLKAEQIVVFMPRYLQEIGYTDTIIDVRSARVRSLLGLQPVSGDSDGEGQPALVNGEQQPSKRDSQNKRCVFQVKLLMICEGDEEMEDK